MPNEELHLGLVVAMADAELLNVVMLNVDAILSAPPVLIVGTTPFGALSIGELPHIHLHKQSCPRKK